MSVTTYQCPNCVAPLTFNPDTQQWKCKFCGASFTLDDLQKQVDAVASEEKTVADITQEQQAKAKAPVPEGEAEAAIYNCPTCGGQVMTDQTTTSTFCVFCHNPVVIADRLTQGNRPTHILPFHLKEAQAKEALRKLCHKRSLLPKRFAGEASIEKLRGLYVPFWLMDYEAQASFEGEGRQVSTWTDTRFAYTKTDTYEILRDLELQFENVPADGSSKMPDPLMHGLEPFDYKEMKPFSMAYLAGYLAETFDVKDQEVQRTVEDRVSRGALNKLRQSVDGYSSVSARQEQVNPQKKGQKLVLFPVWMLMMKFKNQEYLFAMNGQNGKMVGSLPLSKGRAWAYFGIIAAGLTAILTIAGRILL